MKKTFFYVGAYTKAGTNPGITQFTYDYSSGQVQLVSTIDEIENPSFITIDSGQHRLYTVNETASFGDIRSGAATAFNINPKTGALTLINEVAVQGKGPCHLTLSPDRRYLITANYGSGSLSVLPISENGALKEPVHVEQHEGSSVHPKRQTRPHTHSVDYSPDGRYICSANLGTDKIYIYQLSSIGTLTPATVPYFQSAPGAGPRHLAFHKSHPFVYAINELNGTIDALKFDPNNGQLSLVATYSTLPSEFSEHNQCSEVAIHPNGRFLYGVNRGHDSILSFVINTQSGKLTELTHTPTEGKEPRHFIIDPTGQIAIVANQKSNTLVIYKIDLETGTLHKSKQISDIIEPACIQFFS